MQSLLRISRAMELVISFFGRLGAWAVLALVAVTLFDVVTRRFFVLGSTRLQEMEWHIHTVLLMFLIAYGLLRNTHVRVDLVREQLSPKRKAVVELLGNIFFLLPFALLVLYFSFEFVHSSYQMGEGSASTMGLPRRWIIKSTLILAFTLVFMAGLSSSIRHVAFLFGGRDEDVLAPNTGGLRHPTGERHNDA